MPKTGRKSTPTKGAKKTKGQRYEYTELAKASLTSSDPQHCYGVIVDATFPYKVNQSLYVCSLKIVDSSLSASTKGENFATVVIYSKRFEDLPIVLRLGDVIRLHRATLRMYNGQRQFNVSVQWSGSWALFSTDKSTVLGAAAGDYAPTNWSGKKFSFEAHEKATLSNIRKWAGSYFSSTDGVTKDMYKALSTAKKQSADFDVVAKIVGIHEMDAYTNELKLKDGSGSVWYTLALKLKFPHLRTGHAVRVRSCTWDETSTNKQVLALSHYSNILTFIGSSRLASSLGKVTDDWAAEKAALAQATPSHAITISQVASKWAGLKSTNLEELFTSKTLQGDTFRTSFCVTRVEPGNSADACKVWDKKSKKAASAKGAKGELIWQVAFNVKDAATLSNANQYRILNYSHEGLGADFFGKATNLWSDAGAKGKFEKNCANLLKFNVWVDAVVERRNGWYHIKDTKLR
jgi:hypothetical protein